MKWERNEEIKETRDKTIIETKKQENGINE